MFYEYVVTFQWHRGDEYITYVVCEWQNDNHKPDTEREEEVVNFALEQCLRDNGFKPVNYFNVEVVLLDVIEE